VEEGDAPEDVLLELSTWVRNQVSGESPVLADIPTLRNEVETLYRQRNQLRGAISQADLELKAIRNQVDANRPKLNDDMPF
jgi:uncharacterized protein YlxW (UPF0749 family)